KIVCIGLLTCPAGVDDPFVDGTEPPLHVLSGNVEVTFAAPQMRPGSEPGLGLPRIFQRLHRNTQSLRRHRGANCGRLLCGDVDHYNIPVAGTAAHREPDNPPGHDQRANLHWSLMSLHNEVPTPVLLPTGLAMLGAERLFFAEADDLELRRA